MVLHYFVAYDKDKQQFVMIDADDPSYAAYATDGWHDRKLTLTSIDSRGQLLPRHRYVYEINDDLQFTVSWELWREEVWIQRSFCTCRKANHRIPRHS